MKSFAKYVAKQFGNPSGIGGTIIHFIMNKLLNVPKQIIEKYKGHPVCEKNGTFAPSSGTTTRCLP